MQYGHFAGLSRQIRRRSNNAENNIAAAITNIGRYWLNAHGIEYEYSRRRQLCYATAAIRCRHVTAARAYATVGEKYRNALSF